MRISQSFKVRIENKHRFTFPDCWKSSNKHYYTYCWSKYQRQALWDTKMHENTRYITDLVTISSYSPIFMAWATLITLITGNLPKYLPRSISWWAGGVITSKNAFMCGKTHLPCIFIHISPHVLCCQVFWRESVTCTGQYENAHISTNNAISRGTLTSSSRIAEKWWVLFGGREIIQIQSSS